ncbi:4-coumarate--CoA ligase [Coemansia sp. RSA 2711]|nr:4-coumarate--CoA ligase [Coemansia sp. RSA 2711]
MVFRSVIPDVDLPGIDIVSFCMGAAQINAPSADTPAYVDISTGESLTHGELATMHAQLGSGLVNTLDICAGDVVGIFASNSILYAPAFFGIISTGAVCCTVSSTFGEAELVHQLGDCKARALFVGAGQVPVVERALAGGRLDIPRGRIVVMANGEAPQRMVPWSRMLDSRPYLQYRISSKRIAAERMACIVYSSGTTGLPKGVMLSHRNLVACAMLSAASFEYMAQQGGAAPAAERVQRSIAILPFAHIYGLTSLITNSVAGGRTQYIMSSFSIGRFLAAIQRHRIQVASVVPSVMSQIAKHDGLDAYDLSSLQVLGSGAAALPGGVHARIKSRFGGNTINGYGMSETCSGICVMTNHGFAPGSVGFLYPNTEAKIVEPGTGRELGVGEEGELCVRGPTVMLGYMGRPEETRRALDTEGFLHTGDIAYIEPSGLIFITDRIKELIKYKGLQVAPAELEAVLMDHAQVADAAVIGVYDRSRNSEVPMALVVPKTRPADGRALGRSVAAWVAARVAAHKRLRGGVVVVDAIPRNASGKILRRDLRARFNAQHAPRI